MIHQVTFNERLRESMGRISPAEQQVADYFGNNPEEVLISSATALARKTGTSDATVVRTAKALGFSGLEELRRMLAREMREGISPAGRMVRTIAAMADGLESAFHQTLDIHQQSLDALRRDIAPSAFRSAVERITASQRVFVFGLGPSSAMADYFSIQLGRFGIDAHAMTSSGLLLADELQKLRQNDALIVFAYGRVYRELDVLLKQAKKCGAGTILVSDTLGAKLRKRVDEVLPVARGRADLVSMHTATLALIEALLVGVGVERPNETIAGLESLNSLRSALAGKSIKLPTKAGRFSPGQRTASSSP